VSLPSWRSLAVAVRSGPFEVIEGNYQPVRLAMIEFPSMDQARRWYNSEEYRELKQLRLAAHPRTRFFAARSIHFMNVENVPIFGAPGRLICGVCDSCRSTRVPRRLILPFSRQRRARRFEAGPDSMPPLVEEHS
jgi:hypothetical protein